MASTTILQYSVDELRYAKKAGFKRKKPAKPKKKTYNNMVNFVARYNLWVKDMKSKSSQGKDMDRMKEQVMKAGRAK